MSEADKREQDSKPEAQSLLDAVEEDYPERVGGVFGGLSKIGKLFTTEDWLTILMRLRSSFENAHKDKK